MCSEELKSWPELWKLLDQSGAQTSVVHVIRAANRWVAFRDFEAVSAGLKKIHTAPAKQTALAALEEFEALRTGEKYPYQ